MRAILHVEACGDLFEGPVWHQDRLWWVDIEAGQLRNDTGGNFTIGHSVGAALPCQSGRWLLADEVGFAFYSTETGAMERMWTRPQRSPTYRFNDAKVAPDGSVWAGSLKRGTLQGGCSYYRLDTRRQVTEEISHLGLCNGLAWFEDDFYYTDTGAQTIYRVREGKSAVFFQGSEHYPDGCAIDAQGHLWTAVWGLGKVLCLDTSTGKVVQEIELPVPQPSSCCFGGEGLQTLFITTARQGMSAEDLKRYPLSGSIFCCEPGVAVRGIPQNMFNDEETL